MHNYCQIKPIMNIDEKSTNENLKNSKIVLLGLF